MTTKLMEAMTAGVFVELRDSEGNTVGQAVFCDWRGRPTPAVGDSMSCPVRTRGGAQTKSVTGRIVSRQFDVQTDDHGKPSVWVRLIARVVAADRPIPAAKPARPNRIRFSDN